MVAEDEVAAPGRDPSRPFEPGVDRSVGGKNRVGIDDFVELYWISDLEGRRGRRRQPKNNPCEKKTCPFLNQLREHEVANIERIEAFAINMSRSKRESGAT